jgi:hypothetical protein
MKRWIVAVLSVALVTGTQAPAKEIKAQQRGSAAALEKVMGTPVYTWININKISTVLRDNGTADIDVTQNNSGLVYPKGSQKTAIYESGLLWAARIAGDPQVRVGGSAYSSGMQPGKLLSPGVGEDPNLPKNRIYRVRPDFRTCDLSSEITDEHKTATEIREQYERDWNEWPWNDGAPFVDVDGNKVYDPRVDVAGVKGASQTVWFVANDNNVTNVYNLYGSQPMGIECQYTVWAYAQEGELGNMIFKSYLMINKGTNRLDSMYVCQWSDPDLGFANDDLVGCDTTLSLGFVYNSSTVDQTYGSLPPPAAGFDFFQGPRVPSPGSTAIFRGQTIPGYRNLPMTAFFYFINSNPNLEDPTRGDPSGATQFYNYMRGRIGRSGQFFQDPQGVPTTYCLTGDPITGTGWLDGRDFPADDRRMGLSSGPFTMAPGDTQEIVVAEICAGASPGVDRLAAVSLLKFYDKVAQLAYDNFFSVPAPPPAPRVVTSELDREIVLNWGTSEIAIRATEQHQTGSFKFQGYNVYQLPSASATLTEAKKIAVYDLVDGVTRITDQEFDPNTGVVSSKVVQLGTDSGIRRFVDVTTDAFKGGTPLINGVRYYFAVTAYSYSNDPNAIPNNLETPLKSFTLVPHTENPGVRMSSAFGDTIYAVNTGTGPFGDGRVVVQVVDPSRATGHHYRVDFVDAGGETTWKLTDLTTNQVKIIGQSNYSGDDSSPIVDGMIVRVFGPDTDFKRFAMVANGNGPVTEKAGFDVTPAPSYNGYSADWYRDVAQGDGTILDLPAGMQKAGGWYFVVAGGSDIIDYRHAIPRWTREGALWDRIIPNDYEIRFTQAGGQAVWPEEFNTPEMAGVHPVPFEVWCTGAGTPNDKADDVRMIPVIYDETDTAGVPTWGFRLDHEASGGDNDPYSDWIYFYMPADQTPGDAGYKAAMAANPTTRDASWQEHIARLILMNWNQQQGGSPGPVEALPETGTVIRIESNKPSRPTFDAFTFSAPTVVADAELAKEDVAEINVFPNPYYGVNSEELNKYNRFVTFSHLPEEAVIRIFNLAGVQVREIRKNSTSQFERWDLANESGLPVGSGLYIAHIDMPAIGSKKILKLAIVQEQQILDRY